LFPCWRQPLLPTQKKVHPEGWTENDRWLIDQRLIDQ